MTLPRAGGGSVRLGGERPGWQAIVVYRGRHCPICNRYLHKLQDLKSRFDALNTELVAVSADTEAQAASALKDWELSLDLAYGLTVEQMRAWGLYMSAPLENERVGHPFPEPALFVLDPTGRAHIIEVSNAPFVRPDLDGIANGLSFIQAKTYPVRGTLA
jgi:peroxiredoxin